MKLSDVQKRFQAPFPAGEINWKPASFNRERSRALLLAHIDARAVQDRLDAICPDEWSFELEIVTGAARPTVKGRLTILGVVHEDIGEGSEGELGTLKAAASDALKRCAVQFGIGRYLYDLPKIWADWDDASHTPKPLPELPEWARPAHERSPGGAHLMQALEQLKYELPDDMNAQRDVYRHLKAAIQSLHPPTSTAADCSGNGLSHTLEKSTDPLGGFSELETNAVTLTREGAARLHRDLGPLFPNMTSQEVKSWVGTQLGRMISSFEQVRTDEIAVLKAAAQKQVS